MRGFTLIEMVLAVSIMALIAGFSVPVYRQLQVGNDLDLATSALAHSFRRAQLLAQAVSNDQNGNPDAGKWGVKLGDGQITIFSGPNYATRTQAYDELFGIPSSLSQSGPEEVVFAKFTGLPLQTGTITLTSVNNEVRTLTINGKGIVSF